MTDHQFPKFLKYEDTFYNLANLRQVRMAKVAGQIDIGFHLYFDGVEAGLKIDWAHDSPAGLALLAFLEQNTILGTDLNTNGGVSSVPTK